MSQLSYTDTPAVAFAGMKADGTEDVVESRISTEATDAIPFGCFVVSDSVSAGFDEAAKMPSASSGQNFLGIVLHSHAYALQWTDLQGNVHGDLTSAGLAPKAMLNVLVKGRCWVNCETAAKPGDPVFVRYTTDGGSPALTQKGQCGNASGTGRTIDMSAKARFLSTLSAPAAGATGLALIEVDMTA